MTRCRSSHLAASLAHVLLVALLARTAAAQSGGKRATSPSYRVHATRRLKQLPWTASALRGAAAAGGPNCAVACSFHLSVAF